MVEWLEEKRDFGELMCYEDYEVKLRFELVFECHF